MSDSIKHECGIALLRLKKPLEYYLDKYNTAFYGLAKMYLLMEKQHNRGQDGAGLANIKFDVTPGERYISRSRSISGKPIQEIFSKINQRFEEIQEQDPSKLRDVNYLKKNAGFTGELFLGHLRYGASGTQNIESCHPFLRQNNWMTRNLVIAGNFNLTNVDELFDVLLSLGQHPKEKSDAVTVLEKIGHYLDVENEELFRLYKKQGYNNKEISAKIGESLNLQSILQKASSDWDGGYTMAGLLGHGDAFVLRDPNGIRPAFWYEDDEVCVVTSERPVIQTAFNLRKDKIKELTPGYALIIKKNGQISEVKISEPKQRAACSFERIYFSRGNDNDIYQERKMLGQLLVPHIIESVEGDLDNTVFSFIPNTAEMSFYGMMKGLEDYVNEKKKADILALGSKLNEKNLSEILDRRAKFEKIAIKDVKLRTFITQKSDRDDMVAHVYDVTYGTVNPQKDNLVVIDDSIVRGTTLKQSILRMLDRLEPKSIVVVSSAPQVRYPDCYGIDMVKMTEFIAFEAAIELLKETGRGFIIDEVYKKCKEQESYPKEQIKNYVKEIYAPFTDKEISVKIAQMLTPVGMKAELKLVYQTIEGLHKSCPNNNGDWYFSGDYPTHGGNKMVNKAFLNYIEG
ncbi:MAG: amidophosphoribosyltransferase [Brumimicrobium sp.]|nr:amidophosphoribosyltransferase [Brumimicrobium sp.]MCO5269410.1 amidophosphoribosyltransferase [Brumimicrobium sp.]